MEILAPTLALERMMTHQAVWISRLLAGLFVVAGFPCIAAAQQQASDRSPSSTPQPSALVDKYCVACHNENVKTAGLALDMNSAEHPGEHAAAWEKVVRKLRHRQMPPAGLPRPDEPAYDAVVSSLVRSLDSAAAAQPIPGRTDTFRRLTRTEYHNAVRDLLAVDVDVSALLPKDQTSQGFDNITVGGLSPTLLERYLSAAQKISRLAIGNPNRSPGGDTIVLPPDRTQQEHVKGLPFGTRGGTVLHHNFPLDAEYELQVRLSRDRNERVEGLRDPHQLELTLDGQRIELFTVEPIPRGEPHHLVDKDLNVRIHIEAGPHELGAAFIKKTAALLETNRQPYLAQFNSDRHPRTQPALHSMSIIGPYEATGSGDTPSRRRILICDPEKPAGEQACAEQIISALMRRAYRRPVSAADLDVPLKFYQDASAEDGFEAGIEMALRALLVSPHFLFRIEQDPPAVEENSAYRLTDLELASRLSFFLWSSIPDDKLLEAAIQGKLKEPAVLEQQVRRMLADTRSEALVTNFASQWLYLRNLTSVSPNPRLFPDFDDNLRQALRRETELFFQSVLREDRSTLDLLRADYTFVNERLAKHYGIPNVYGSRFRRVTFGEESVRGGLLSQGSMLTVTSYANRTSPVLRGKWILANILGTPVPPPPAEVPPLEESGAAGKILSMRERMAEHRANPACASCHNLMDPVGLALENYDAIGRWRSADPDAPVDVSGSLPDGARFDGASELRHALLTRPELFVTNVTEKLLTYALGRGLEYYDAVAVRKIVRDARPNDYRLPSLILGIVNSTPYQMRMSQMNTSEVRTTQ